MSQGKIPKNEAPAGESFEGKKLPHVTFHTRVRDDSVKPNPFKWQEVTTEDIFKGKKVVLLSLPGAYTPTCSSTHLPGYDKKINEFKELGVDQVVCVSVNDAFVMYNWAKNLDVNNVFMLPDGNADFTKHVGMLVKKSNLGFGLRSWRYSMYVEDLVVKKQFIERGFNDDFAEDPFASSDADTMLSYLREKRDFSSGAICEGKKLPHVVFRTRVRDESQKQNPFAWKDVSTEDLFKGKKIVLLGLPGAFTPTCSTTHLPGYDKKIEEFKKAGVDQVICISVNDAFVMFQWAKHLDVNNIFMLPDGNGEFTEKIGMLVTKSNLGFGLRSWRYSMYVDDMVVKKQFVEKGFADDFGEDPFEVSDADTMLNYLQKK